MKITLLAHPTGKIWSRYDGVVVIQNAEGVCHSEADVQFCFETVQRYAGGKAPILVDRRLRYGYDFAALKKIRREIGHYATAVAILGVTQSEQFAATSMAEHIKDQVPARVFVREEDALKWLHGFAGSDANVVPASDRMQDGSGVSNQAA